MVAKGPCRRAAREVQETNRTVKIADEPKPIAAKEIAFMLPKRTYVAKEIEVTLPHGIHAC